MQQLWDDEEARFMGLSYWHVGGWKYLADALRLIAASNAPGKKYLRLSSEDAQTLQKYWDANTTAPSHPHATGVTHETDKAHGSGVF